MATNLMETAINMEADIFDKLCEGSNREME
jgi:hypothetical protein